MRSRRDAAARYSRPVRRTGNRLNNPVVRLVGALLAHGQLNSMCAMRWIADCFMWMFCGFTLWLTAHSIATFLPVHGLWLPPSACIAGIIMGLLGYISLQMARQDHSLDYYVYQDTSILVGGTGILVGFWFGSSYYLRSTVYSVGLTNMLNFLSALICGALGLAASAGTVEIMRRLGQRRIFLFLVLVLAILLQGAIVIGVSFALSGDIKLSPNSGLLNTSIQSKQTNDSHSPPPCRQDTADGLVIGDEFLAVRAECRRGRMRPEPAGWICLISRPVSPKQESL
jgi:hypothetical protein